MDELLLWLRTLRRGWSHAHASRGDIRLAAWRVELVSMSKLFRERRDFAAVRHQWRGVYGGMCDAALEGGGIL